MAKRIEALNARLNQIHRDKTNLSFAVTVCIEGSVTHSSTASSSPCETASLYFEYEITGIEEDTKLLKQWLTEPTLKGLHVFAICGMGGIGKTTLAQKVCDEGDIKSYFENRIIWTFVSRDFNGNDLLKQIITSVGGRCDEAEMSLLSSENGWSLLRKVVSQGRDVEEIESLKDVGTRIIEKCKGLPLAIKVIGGVLKGKERNKNAWEVILSNDLWSNSIDNPSEIMSALLLSYMDLPPHLKPCFLYCSLFPEDWKIHQKDLIRMWMAEGFVEDEGKAEEYYVELVMRSLLQQAYDTKINYCKLHDHVRDMAVSMTKSQHLFGNQLQSLEVTSVKPRRLSITGNEEMMQLSEGIKKKQEENFRSFCVFRGWLISKFPVNNVFPKFKRLRVLHLIDSRIQNLPDSISEVTHLRYLSLNLDYKTELPDSLSSLEHLQTLNLYPNENIQKLPRDLPRLQSLRHLEGVGHVDMPAGIGALTNLRTLYGFKVNFKTHCNIKELQPLSLLRRLKIGGLDRVPNGVEAKKAALQKKTHLQFLKLACDESGVIHVEQEIKRIEEIFKELCPFQSLEELAIKNFIGRELPSWVPMMENLKCLKLDTMINVRRLPSVGQMPQLRALSIKNSNNIVILDSEFFFGEQGRCGGGGAAFPKLKYLRFNEMQMWKEWTTSGANDLVHHHIFPCLETVVLASCPELASLTTTGLERATNLTKLVLEHMDNLESFGDLKFLKKLNILKADRLEALYNLPRLQWLSIRLCPAFRDMANLNSASLKYIGIEVLSQENMEALNSLTSTNHIWLDISGKKGYVAKDGPYWPIIQHFSNVNVHVH
ncbi:Disease resistance RPP13-like protein 4 [Acorus calamus]|uniref:Disease resistance RPP13-like protein 4 n=1 Tax=Acorus calamus TaxID=4465 RepID=A0AAV9CSL9_ACOCL|nr:Disease resistance RPP13-like protein 4 [Acorus calamus]